MASNQAAAARRQREWERIKKRREKQAAKVARREQKAEEASASAKIDDPMNDPTIDWGDAVREVELPPDDEEESEQAS